MYQMPLFEAPQPFVMPMPAEDRCVDDIYTAALYGYDCCDFDMMQCCLNEIARLCTQYFQMKDDV